MMKRNGATMALGATVLLTLAGTGFAAPNQAGHSAIAADALPVIKVQAGVCADLWVERNEIFKGAGYCFRTARAIQTFGNAGCQYDNEADVPLSQVQRRRIAAIRAEERSLGCTP